ncbi:YhdP family protein [Rhizobium sp. SAFR-030]|uniref:YhdP family protein n=1 Tax=Rhizobium sp. SAFR-030 TaxID=3387277 RepID=UPI003F81136F
MAEIRGEKVRFRRKDMIPLHALPSAQAHDPVIVHCPPRRRRIHSFARYVTWLAVLIAAAVASAFFAIETGAVDGALNARAQAALNGAIGNRYRATVGSTAIRFDSDFRLALVARDVDIVEVATGEHLTRTGAVRLAIDPLALASGRVSIRHMEAENISLDTALLPAGDPMDLSTVRVDRLPASLEQAFQRLDEARGLIERTGTGSVRISGINIQFPPDASGKVSTLVVSDLNFTMTDAGQIALKGRVELNGRPADLTVDATAVNGVTRMLTARIVGLDLTPFLLQRMEDGSPREGLEGSIALDLNAQRDTAETEPAIKAEIHHDRGRFYFDGIGQELSGAEIRAAYDFTRNSIQIMPSELRFGPTVLPLSGALIDLNRIDAAEQRPGFGLDLLVSGGKAQGSAGGEEPVLFDMKAGGRYLSRDRQLEFDEMQVSSPMGQMAGALKIHFPGNQSPEISFGAQLPRMDVAAVKQLWPFWMAHKPRDWVTSSLFGGTVTNGSISVFIPAGRMKGPGQPMELNADELRVAFDIADNRLTLPGELPPLRDVAGHFDLKGERLRVDLKSANAYFPSGRTVNAEGGSFTIGSTYSKPLMADLEMTVSGAADAVAELATFKPINGLKGTDFKPEDFSGKAKATVHARFGLINDQQPPAPTFKASVALDGVDLAKPMEGRTVTDVDGTLDIDDKAVRLNAKASIDTVPAEVTLVEPIGSQSNVARELSLSATLNDAQREKLAPGLSDIIKGQIGLELSRIDAERQLVKLDLGKATLSVPWVGWTKGSGIAAKASAEVQSKDGNTTIQKLDLSGDGFGINGKVALDKGGLSSADFSHVQLSPADDFAASIRRGKGIYDVSLTGSAADLRPVLSKFKNGSGEGGKQGSGKGSDAARVKAKLDRIVGFNDESIRNANLSITVRDGDMHRVEFSGVTASGQAVVAKTASGSAAETITLTSGDAGAVARFADLYDHLRGGLLNIRLDNEEGDDWSGSIDIRSFSLVNESRLQSIVSTPVGEDGRSLNSAVKRDIDVSSAKFQRGFARVVYRQGALSLQNGVVRGEQIGATFQGMVRDAAGNMDLTGTFMPAYGLNRLFAELPIIGTILGNGRDRGLLGITFKVAGSMAQPKLTVNPLSIIAPGVFRQIFEFQ